MTTPPDACRRRIALLAAVALAAAVGLVLHGPIAQWPDYHAFADARPWLAVPNAANVLGNAPFAVVGWWAWRALGAAPEGPSRAAWRTVAVAVFATAFGSAWYHWNPTDASLVVDRVPIAWACAAIACALLAERVDARWGAWPVVLGGVGLATASVLWWVATGDLRPYVFVQFAPLLLVATALLARLAPIDPARALGDGAWWAGLGLYAVAKACEAGDHAIHDVLAPVSGHALKHLVAAAAGAVLLRAAVAGSRARTASRSERSADGGRAGAGEAAERLR